MSAADFLFWDLVGCVYFDEAGVCAALLARDSVCHLGVCSSYQYAEGLQDVEKGAPGARKAGGAARFWSEAGSAIAPKCY
jgi:hypothetical protein